MLEHPPFSSFLKGRIAIHPLLHAFAVAVLECRSHNGPFCVITFDRFAHKSRIRGYKVLDQRAPRKKHCEATSQQKYYDPVKCQVPLCTETPSAVGGFVRTIKQFVLFLAGFLLGDGRLGTLRRLLTL